MTRIRLHLKALSPLAFGARRGTTSVFVDTLDYVPGTTLRGAVAARYLRDIGAASDERFRRIFLGDGICFSNLYPRGHADTSYVIPATARSCKAHEGFRADGDPRQADVRHGVGDTLMRAAAFHLSEDYSLLDAIADCPTCRQPTERFEGFYERHEEYRKVSVEKRHLTHVGINRQTGTAEREFLYARQVINEKQPSKMGNFREQVFDGELIVAEDLAGFVTGELLSEGTLLRVGESRTRGLGRVEVIRAEEVEGDTCEEIRDRIRRFNEAFSEQCPPPAGRAYVSITLQSDAVLMDAFMRPRSRLAPEDIHEAPGAARLVYANAGTRLIQSWNMASGYPKRDDVAVRMGSVFLFEVEEGGAAGLAGAMLALQERGIGRRRGEGFGRVSVCDRFHTEVHELWQAI